MNHLLQIGLIGVGPWGLNYLRTIMKMDDVQLRWVCSPHRRIENLPAGCQFTHDYHSLLHDKHIDALIIATPPGTHYDLATSALSAEKDILVEKPMTLSSGDALKIVTLSEKSSRILMVGHIYLYHPVTRVVRKMITEGELGTLIDFSSDRSSPGPGRNDINVMWDYAPHDFSLMNYLTGENPTRVFVQQRDPLNHMAANSVDIVVTYPSGIKGSIYNGWTGAQKTRKVIISGSKKTVLFDDISKELSIHNLQNGTTSQRSFLNETSPLELQCSYFFDCVRTREKPVTDASNGYTIIRILQSAQESLETGKEIALDWSK
ncbi:Gfo/Idh/MocA family oxidoreductase [Candidatus Woesearchaeota archaeon]|nr:Gfo/Idh/MocA family oxidoreductase [Candidatus Woesearchaeota archaeon]